MYTTRIVRSGTIQTRVFSRKISNNVDDYLTIFMDNSFQIFIFTARKRKIYRRQIESIDCAIDFGFRADATHSALFFFSLSLANCYVVYTALAFRSMVSWTENMAEIRQRLAKSA